MTEICMVVYRATAGGAVLAVLLSSSQDVFSAWKQRPRRSRLRRNAISRHAHKCIAKLTPQAMTASSFFLKCFSARLALDRSSVSAASLGCDLMGTQFARSPCHEDAARSSSSAPSELLMEEVLSACGSVQPQTLGFLEWRCVAG